MFAHASWHVEHEEWGEGITLGEAKKAWEEHCERRWGDWDEGLSTDPWDDEPPDGDPWMQRADMEREIYKQVEAEDNADE